MVKEVTYYRVLCDKCGEILTECPDRESAEAFEFFRQNDNWEMLCLYDVCKNASEKESYLDNPLDTTKLKETDK